MVHVNNAGAILARTGLARMTALPFALLLVLPCAAQADPDPVALLRGVEAAREPLRGRLMMKMTSQAVRPPKKKAREVTLDITFDREKRRFIVEELIFRLNRAKPGQRPTPSERYKELDMDSERAAAEKLGRFERVRTRVVYDGTQVMEFADPAVAAAIKDPKEGASALCFDPRILGLSRLLMVTRTLEDSLDYRTAKEVRLVGQETIRGQPVWHVVVVVPVPNLEYHFWVEDREGYRVHRFEYRTAPPTHLLAELYYDQPGPFPTKVVVSKTDPRGEDRVTWVVEKAELGPRPDPSLFTLKGLELPPGQMVTDYRIKRVEGYWDGESLTKDRAQAVKQAADVANNPSRGWLYPTLVSVGALGLLAVAVRYYRQRHAAP